MKKFTKILSMVLLVAMCMSMLTISAFADGVPCLKDSARVCYAGAHTAYVAPTCDTTGKMEHWACADNCGQFFADKECTQLIENAATAVVIPALGHSFTTVTAVEPDCKNGGNLAYQVCTVCGDVYDMDGNVHANGASDFALNPDTTAHNWGEWVETKAPTSTANGREERECSVCGEKQGRDVAFVSAFEITSKNGMASYTYSDANDLYGYIITDPDNHKLDYVTANGETIDIYSYDSKKGIITLDGSEFSSTKDVVIHLRFVSEKGEVVSGFSISKPENQKNETLEINGVGDVTYVRGSGLNVNFKSNSELQDIVLYDLDTRTPVAAIFSSQISSVNGIYTYTFDNDYLDLLDCHKYQIRCYWGSADDSYAEAGYLNVTDSPVTTDIRLYFTNGEKGDNSFFKYQSGAEEPRLYCQLFLIDGARLQIKSDNTGWSDVNVYNYYVEPSKGKDTAYAYIDDAFLNTLDSDNNYYFRVVVPEARANSTYPLNSNTVTLQVGATLRPVDTAKHVINSTKNLRFVCSEDIAKVYVGNIELTDDDDFAVSTNGKTVTLSADFLNKRTAGNTYTIKVLTKDGEYASTTFQILTTAQASASPRTGDTSNIGLWAAALLVSGAAAVAVLPRLKKEQ